MSIPGTHHEKLTRTRMWRAFVGRDRRYDGRFVTGVRTTGIYCRPSCSCRKPRPEHVEYFASGPAAAAAGYRPCKRCRPELAGGAREAAERAVAEAMARVAADPARRWTVAALGREVAMSGSLFARAFRAVRGETPMRAVRRLRLERARTALMAGDGVLDAALDAGFHSPSAFARAFRAEFGSSPAEWRRTTPRRSR
jgi:AraC family transcriptional regulator of adaptative response/methylated-DNA-[protein]-cysteine methyltransferase